MAQPPNTGASTRRRARPSARRTSAHPLSGAAALALVVVVLAVSCASPSPEPEPEALPVQPPIPIPEPLPDTRGVAVVPVAGTVGPFPVSVRGGDLVLAGTVVGPDGPAAGAVVRLERFVGPRSGRLDVRTDDRGRWRVGDAVGGRYRIRAWRAPDLAMTSSELAFLAADEPVDLALTVDRFDGADLTGEVDNPRPAVGDLTTVTVLATRQQVDGDGIITTAPAAGRDAEAVAVGPWEAVGSPRAVVDGSGRVAWRFRCTDEGSVSALVNALGRRLTVSATCSPPAIPPPSAEPRPDFPVGSSFTPPFDGPVPAGTYRVTDDPGTCGLTYQAWDGQGWDPVRRTATGTGTVVIDTVARDLAALGDSPPCTYERVS